MISVCIASYNGQDYIKKQIESILCQLSNEDELIISDDKSSDNTVDIVRDFLDPRIKIYINEEKGYVSNFENALKHVNGSFVFLSDQDDIWVKNKVEICMKHLQKVDLIVSDCMLIDSDEMILAESFYDLRKPYRTRIGNLLKFGFLGCCLSFRSSILEKALPFPRNRKLCTHDNWLFLIGSWLYSYEILSDKLVLYRRHSSNLSPGSQSANTNFLFKLRYRVYLFINLVGRCISK